MFKFLIISLALFGSISVQAATSITVIGWGVDGATAKARPAANSGEMAAAVYAAIGGTGQEITLSADDAEITADDSSATIVIADNLDNIKATKNSNGNPDVAVKGSPAQFLYESLNVAPTSMVGALNKAAGNIHCAKGVNQNGAFYSCLIKDVTIVQMPVQ